MHSACIHFDEKKIKKHWSERRKTKFGTIQAWLKSLICSSSYHFVIVFEMETKQSNTEPQMNTNKGE